MITLFGYRWHLDALLARIVYRWWGRTLLLLLALIGIGGLGSGLIPPFWRGQAMLTLRAAPGATVLVDGHVWSHVLYAGTHTVVATLPDGRRAWATITVQASQVLTLTLPSGLLPPRTRVLPPAAPGMQIASVWWADGGWRVSSVPLVGGAPDDTRHAAEPTPTPAPGQTVAVRPQSIERLPTLDAYGGLADQMQRDGHLLEAVYRAAPNRSVRDEFSGSVEVRGWGASAHTLPISAPLTLVRFAPDGRALLLAEQIAPTGTQVYLVRPGVAQEALVAVPGLVTDLSWRPDSSAVVLYSVQGERLTLTLVRLRESGVAAVIAELPIPQNAPALVPLAWDDAGVRWIAPDTDDAFWEWSAPLTTLLPERGRPMDARALTVLPDGTVRVLRMMDGGVVIGRYEGAVFIGETWVARIPSVVNLVGRWQGAALVLQGAGQAWLLDVGEG